MTAEPDVGRIVEYDHSPANKLNFAAWGILVGALLLAMGREGAGFAVAGVAVLVCAVAFAIYALFGRGHPVMVASPLGLHYRLSGVGAYFIPWPEIKSIDSVDFTAGAGKRRVRFTGATVLLVPADFCHRHIHVDSALRRGPNWDWFFRPRGDLVEIVLHHEWFRVAPQEVRGPIEARWQAFRHREPPVEPPPAPVRAAFGREGAPLIYGTRSPASPWNTVTILAPLLGGLWILGHVLGLW